LPGKQNDTSLPQIFEASLNMRGFSYVTHGYYILLFFLNEHFLIIDVVESKPNPARGQSEFTVNLQWLEPDGQVISLGAHQHFGHPIVGEEQAISRG
jgi:hypothetical protein